MNRDNDSPKVNDVLVDTVLTQRVTRLERMLSEVVNAILREGTEMDGNFGWSRSVDVLIKVKNELDGGVAAHDGVK